MYSSFKTWIVKYDLASPSTHLYFFPFFWQVNLTHSSKNTSPGSPCQDNYLVLSIYTWTVWVISLLTSGFLQHFLAFTLSLLIRASCSSSVGNWLVFSFGTFPLRDVKEFNIDVKIKKTTSMVDDNKKRIRP